MAQTIKIKRSSVAGKVPATTDLDLGELAVNTHDGKVYTKKDNGTESIVEVTPNGLTNDNIAAGAAIADTKLATISTAGKVSNSATTATSANTASAIVARDANGDIAVTSINSGPLAGMRNAIVNGNFDIWQRGTSFTNLEYGADRWLNVRTGSTCTMSRISWALGAAPGEYGTFACRMTVGSVAGAANAVNLTQRIESVRTLAGQQVTVSFWAKANANKNIAVDFLQNFGTGGSPSPTVTGIGVSKFAITTSWVKYTVTATMPSVSGKTAGTDGNDYLALVIWFDAGSDFNARTDTLGQQSGTFDIAQVQLEAGPVATPFERRPIGVELALCQRYYELSDLATTSFSGNVTSGQDYDGMATYRVTKRAVPNITLSNLGANNFSTTVGTIVASGQGGFRERRTANGTGMGRFFSTWTSDAEL